MMFLRTKCGIERALYGEDFYEGKSYFYKTEYQWDYGDTYHKVKTKTYAKNGITKIANSIKELCDEFVVWEEDYKNPISCPLTEKERYEQIKRTILLGKFGGIKCWLKLAIWTDKGLIYVAKMNEKGEL